MVKFIQKNKTFVVAIMVLIGLTFIDVQLTINSLENTMNQLISMLLIVPPIFILIGLIDVWVPREMIINLMGEESKIKGMFLAFLLGAFSAGPTVVAFPIAHLMLHKGAKYSNVLFFLFVWSSLKIPIIFYQVTAIGFYLPLIINTTMLLVFIVGSLLTKVFFNNKDIVLFEQKASSTVKKDSNVG